MSMKHGAPQGHRIPGSSGKMVRQPATIWFPERVWEGAVTREETREDRKARIAAARSLLAICFVGHELVYHPSEESAT